MSTPDKLPDFEDIPAFSSPEEADAWMAERERAAQALVDLARLMQEFARTFTWWGSHEDDMKIGYSTKRMTNGKFGWAVLDPDDRRAGMWGSGLIEHGICTRRRDAKAKAIKAYVARNPLWAAKHPDFIKKVTT